MTARRNTKHRTVELPAERYPAKTPARTPPKNSGVQRVARERLSLRAGRAWPMVVLLPALLSLTSCWESDVSDVPTATAESCMSCHNGALHDDYSGPGMENPHPFGAAATLKCTQCHGGNGAESDMEAAHVPPPPEIGSEAQQILDPVAYFNRLTLTGIDKYADYEVGGITYSAIDYLQFINPGDLRVVTQGRSCGECHAPHVDCVAKSVLATEAGILSSSMYTLGIENAVPANRGLYEDTAAEFAFRAILDPDFTFDANVVGPVGELQEFPVYSQFGGTGSPDDIFENPAYDALNLDASLNADNSVIPGSPMAHLFREQVAFTCGDCHLGSAGANNRYGDFRSSGCTACHMRYSLDGRSRSTDPNITKFEPLDPDEILPPERAHVDSHRIRSVAQTLPSGEFLAGIDDYTCAGCHQGSNRTVMQFWGIRLDQNADLRNGHQYPADPITFRNTNNDPRLFDPDVNNRTFNGRNANQYILEEDYDGDGKDDTPPDCHYEAGLGCIDCHGSHDLHGGTVGAGNGAILSHQEQAVAIRCESCHGTVDEYAPTVPCVTYDGLDAECVTDSKGNPLKHVTRDADGNYTLVSRLTGQPHYIKQTKDTVWDNGVIDPISGLPVYNERASYAMGRNDGDPSTGTGPLQTDAGAVAAGFSHTDELSCVACHASWTNNCIGCHLGGEYDANPNRFFFSNITGERIVFDQANADFVYQSPVPFQLGIDPHNKISPITANTTTFFQYEDLNNNNSDIYAFTDRNGNGNNPNVDGRNAFGALSHNSMMPHSIRGRVTETNEGPRYCVACHLTDEAIFNFGAEYDTFRTAMASNDVAALDFPLLQQHIGQNPGNQLNSPFWVHMVAGLGSGLFLFDENGCPVNPLDDNANRVGCDDVAPATKFDPAAVVYNLDRIVEDTGVANSSNNHPFLEPGGGTNKRDGANNQNLAGPLGGALVQRLTDPVLGLVLDSWLDANGAPQGDASNYVTTPATAVEPSGDDD